MRQSITVVVLILIFLLPAQAQEKHTGDTAYVNRLLEESKKQLCIFWDMSKQLW